MYTYICKEVAKLVCKCINKFYFSKIYAKFSISGKHCRTFLMRHANLHLTQKQAGMVRNFSLKLMTSKFKWKVRYFLKDFAWAVIDNIQEECSVRFTLSFHSHCGQMQTVNQNLTVPFFSLISSFRAVKRICSCVADFILVVVYFIL